MQLSAGFRGFICFFAARLSQEFGKAPVDLIVFSEHALYQVLRSGWIVLKACVCKNIGKPLGAFFLSGDFLRTESKYNGKRVVANGVHGVILFGSFIRPACTASGDNELTQRVTEFRKGDNAPAPHFLSAKVFNLKSVAIFRKCFVA